MWKLGLRPRYSFSVNICFKVSAFCLCSVLPSILLLPSLSLFWYLPFACYLPYACYLPSAYYLPYAFTFFTSVTFLTPITFLAPIAFLKPITFLTPCYLPFRITISNLSCSPLSLFPSHSPSFLSFLIPRLTGAFLMLLFSIHLLPTSFLTPHLFTFRIRPFFSFFLWGFFLFMYDIQHCFICRPSDSPFLTHSTLSFSQSNFLSQSVPHRSNPFPIPHSLISYPTASPPPPLHLLLGYYPHCRLPFMHWSAYHE